VPELPRFGYRGELAFGPMIYLRARAYDAVTGRFTTRDPLSLPSGQAGAARYGNRYVYAGNDPANFTDPTGEQFGFISDIGHAFDRGIHDVGHDISRIPSIAHRGLDESSSPGRVCHRSLPGT
jgi:RHS repeat-associated protein